jgi:hypothetical protein
MGQQGQMDDKKTSVDKDCKIGLEENDLQDE